MGTGLDLNRIFIRNKMMYPVRVLVELTPKGGKYQKVQAKDEIGPVSITPQVYAMIKDSRNIEVCNFEY